MSMHPFEKKKTTTA